MLDSRRRSYRGRAVRGGPRAGTAALPASGRSLGGGDPGALALWRVRHGIGGKFIAAATGIIDLSELIESGTAIGCMARTHALRYGARLWQIPVQAAPPVIDVFSVVDVERHMTPVETALLDHLEEAGLAARPIPRSET